MLNLEHTSCIFMAAFGSLLNVHDFFAENNHFYVIKNFDLSFKKFFGTFFNFLEPLRPKKDEDE